MAVKHEWLWINSNFRVSQRVNFAKVEHIRNKRYWTAWSLSHWTKSYADLLNESIKQGPAHGVRGSNSTDHSVHSSNHNHVK